jgi:histidyl-tRNA synthetase
MDYLERSLKAQMREANRQKAEKVLIIGEEEMKKGKAVLKDMQTGEQKEINLDRIDKVL